MLDCDGIITDYKYLSDVLEYILLLYILSYNKMKYNSHTDSEKCYIRNFNTFIERLISFLKISTYQLDREQYNSS